MSQWTTISRTSTPAPGQTPKPTPEERRMQREEQTFRRGQQAAATLIRALAIPDRTVQLAVAKVLSDAAQRAGSVIAQEGIARYERERHEPGSVEGQALPNLRRWYSGPDASDAEPADHTPLAIPA